jgi:hypothetical protein
MRPQYQDQTTVPRNWPYFSGSAPAFPEGRCAGLRWATSPVDIGQTYNGEGGIRLRPRLGHVAGRPHRCGKTQAAVPFDCRRTIARFLPRLKSGVSSSRKVSMNSEEMAIKGALSGLFHLRRFLRGA